MFLLQGTWSANIDRKVDPQSGKVSLSMKEAHLPTVTTLPNHIAHHMNVLQNQHFLTPCLIYLYFCSVAHHVHFAEKHAISRVCGVTTAEVQHLVFVLLNLLASLCNARTSFPSSSNT